MKKIWVLMFLLTVVLSGRKLKTTYDQYIATHLPASTVVYYLPQHIYLHIAQECPELYGGRGSTIRQDTYGRMKNSKMSNELCPVCVPAQYIH